MIDTKSCSVLIIQLLKTDFMPDQFRRTAPAWAEPKSRSQVSVVGHSAAVFGGLSMTSPGLEQPLVLASSRDRITTTPSIMMNMMTIMIAIY